MESNNITNQKKKNLHNIKVVNKKLTTDEKNKLIQTASEEILKLCDKAMQLISNIQQEQNMLIENAKNKLKEINGEDDARQLILKKLTLDRKIYQYNSARAMAGETIIKLKRKEIITQKVIDDEIAWVDGLIKADNLEYLADPMYELFGITKEKYSIVIPDELIEEELELLKKELI